MSARVLSCGLATVDVVQTVERVPTADEKVVARSTRVDAGGPALNAALTAALLGMPCRLVTAVGTSALAEVVRGACREHAVELVDMAGPAFRLPVASVLVTEGTGERAVAASTAAGPVEWPSPGARGAVDAAGLLDGVSAVLLDGHHQPLARRLVRAARTRGIPVLLDAGSWKDGLGELLADVDVLVASADFRAPGSGGSLEDLLALGPGWVARSAGSDPVRWLSADGRSGSVPVPVVEVVDTLGAGDVLHGALLAELGRREPGEPADLPALLPRALTAAVRVASSSVAAPGARGWAHPGAGPGPPLRSGSWRP